MRLRADGLEMEFPEQVTLYRVLTERHGSESGKYLLAYENGRLRELHHRAHEGAEITFVSRTDKTGYETYRRSAVMLFQSALCSCTDGQCRGAVLHFSFGSGFYLTLEDGIIADRDLLDRVSEKMRVMVKAAFRFEKRSVPTSDAIRLFAGRGMHDKEKLFRTRIASRVNVYSLCGYEDYFYGFMAYDTSVIDTFELVPFNGGLLLNLPKREEPWVLPEIRKSDKLFDAQVQGELWAIQQGIGTVADLNEQIIFGDLSHMILTAEALQESSISDIAEQVANRENVKFVMIAGPSSSGKTTFSQRLCIQLTSHGLTPHYIGVDNYFINREDMVAGPDGKKDFESLSAVDVKQFNEDMCALLDGQKVKMPSFDFIEGKRVYRGEELSLGDGEILVIEGIHCLNDELSHALPAESKFRIYISALTQLNIDDHNRIPTTDGRLLRRIVRDNRTRGNTASQTIAQWDSVRSGEEKNIFPFQESADVFFNSALPYEIAALKVYVEPLLFQVREDDPSYQEAKRLLKFLDYFIAIPASDIPTNSLLREFIGGGCFRL